MLKNAPEYAVYYQFGRDDIIKDDWDVFRIVAKAPHQNEEEGMLYLIQDELGRCYLLHKDGIAPIKNKKG